MMKLFRLALIPFRATLAVAVLMPGLAIAQAVPSYDISTVKPHEANDGNVSVNVRPANLKISNMTAQNLIALAWNVRPWLVTGLPPWGKSGHFDVDAKVSEPDLTALRALSDEERRLMIQNLLKERFHLDVHSETRTLPVYELSVMPEGDKLKPSAPLPAPEPGQPAPRRSASMSKTDGHIVGKGVSIRGLADSLANELERYVVDKTGLTGDYDVELRWTPQDSTNAPGDAGIAAEPSPPLATAVREQLGLRLTPSKGPVPAIVVDHIEPPTDN
ncbi:TIGR03435 family protein [Terriglobus roseus]|uniref:Soil-associated protein, TIGR03435 family n=1 Tax=Terriglobus roseus TaxID=392734 RepID=A0A1H4NBN8_9BACT|nr:TIGR03435 family protein [Terriglobus roseus]SEB92178.1 soil-associated protein, TIGR03435 family [Terriglobus roseus]